MKSVETENILGYPVTSKDIQACIRRLISWIQSEEKGKYAVCVNPHSMVIARSDPLFRDAILDADLVVPDGTGIITASKILGGGIRNRITGSDIFWELSRALDCRAGYRYFFLGSTEENLSRIRDRMETNFPNIEVAGTFSPPFRQNFSPEESRRMIESVNQARPHVLWVGMTAPTQEKWVYQHKHLLNANLSVRSERFLLFWEGRFSAHHAGFRNTGLNGCTAWFVSRVFGDER